jgi:hypothetical protein
VEYVLGCIVVLFIIYKIVIGLGRKNAKDVLVANFGVSRMKLDQMRDPEITSLTASLNAFARSGDIESLERLVSKYK